jgi:hypothetical protein
MPGSAIVLTISRWSSAMISLGTRAGTMTARVVAVAFEMAHIALGLAERSDPANEMIAKRIIELAKTGELNPDLLCEAVLKEFREQRL